MYTRLESAAGLSLFSAGLLKVLNFPDRLYKDTRCVAAFTARSLSVYSAKKKHIRYKPRGGASGNAHLFTCLSTLHHRGMFCCFVVLYVCVWYVCGQCVFFTTSAREVLRYRSVKRASFCRNFVVATVVFHKAGPLPYAL